MFLQSSRTFHPSKRLLKLPQFERFLTCRESVTKNTGICMDFFQLELKRVHKAKTISILENGTLILNICKNPVSRKFFGLVQDSRSFSGDSKFPIYLSYYQRQLSKFESLSFLSIFLFLFVYLLRITIAIWEPVRPLPPVSTYPVLSLEWVTNGEIRTISVSLNYQYYYE